MGVDRLAGKVIDGARGLGLRVLVHLFALFCAGSGMFAAPPGLDADSAGAGIYLGIICLLARETEWSYRWLGPCFLGLGTTGLLLIVGFPSCEAIFWGGAQAWLQRLILKRGRMGLEWVAGLFLLAGITEFLPAATRQDLLLASFLTIAMFGAVALRRIDLARNPGEDDDDDAEDAPDAAPEADRGDAAPPDPWAEFREAIATLRKRQFLLVPEIRPVVLGIAASAEDIIRSMERDPRDREPGGKFLRRYLPAAVSLAEQHGRFSNENVSAPEVAEALEKAESTLRRLQDAFAKEYAMLLRNDVDDFSADLGVLDKLLKMDGK